MIQAFCCASVKVPQVVAVLTRRALAAVCLEVLGCLGLLLILKMLLMVATVPPDFFDRDVAAIALFWNFIKLV